MQPRFAALLSRFGATAPEAGLDAAGTALLAAYSTPKRFYHTAAHLADVMEKLDWAKTALQDTGELDMMTPREAARMFDVIELALWYHDAVYDATLKDNEAKSRDWFLKDAKIFGLAEDLQRDVAALIDLTAHHKKAATLPERILTDCDLAILGAAPADFAVYDANIRKEYAHVPAAAYKTGRYNVLQGFLNQPQVFKTGAFRNKYEAAARANLSATPKPAVLRLRDWLIKPKR
ncbi:MAG: hypothetical protein PW788_11345 [Micavibrio sp.]|nr:hypothetical protein [Micavibrio sp.]